MSDKLFIPIILGTAREGRQSEKVAKFVLAETKKHPNITTELLDVRDFRPPATDNTGKSDLAKKFAEKISPADGFIIVSPEYNRSYPGELKMMLDMLRTEYRRKPLAICGVSNGPVGGGRMVEQLRIVAIDLQMVPIRAAVLFPNVDDLFDDNQEIRDPGYAGKVAKMLQDLVWYAAALRHASLNPGVI